MPSVIDVTNLVKRYGDLTAVAGVTFSVEQGEIFGFLGPNGAGKTTTLEMLEGLTIPTSGSAHVLGDDIVRDSRRIRARIGVQLQATALPMYTKVGEAVDLFGALYANSRSTADLLTEFNLTEKAGAYAGKLSGGQMQRLSIALALVNDPELVFLDEPTTGLDPQARLNLWAVIEGIRKRGRTVMLTSHYMEEAERLCDRVAVMDKGKIVAMGTPLELITRHAPGTTVEFTLPQGVEADAFTRIAGVDRVDATDQIITIHTTSAETVLRALLDPTAPWASSAPGSSGDSAIRDLRVHQGTLEDVFITMTGRTLRS